MAKSKNWKKANDGPDEGKISLQYISKEDYERSVNGDSAEDHTQLGMVFDQARDILDSGHCLNIPLAGVVEMTFQNEILTVPVGMHGDKLYIPGLRDASEEEKANARFTLAEQRHVNFGLLHLRGLIGRANKQGKQVSLVIVNRGDNEHLRINNQRVRKAALKEFFIDLQESCGDKKLPIMIIDCGTESKATMALMDEMGGKYLSADWVLCNYEDARGPDHAPTRVDRAAKVPGADQPAAKPADDVPAAVQPSTPTSKTNPR